MEFIRFLNKLFLQPARRKITAEIYEKDRVTWTQLDYRGLGINPLMIQHHTGVLLEAEIIQRASPHGFEFTHYGKRLYEIYLQHEARWIRWLKKFAKHDPELVMSWAEQAKDWSKLNSS